MTNLKSLRNQFAAVLSRDEMKNVTGGYVVPDIDDEAGCYTIESTQGHESCWYAGSAETAATLCARVYGENCDPVSMGPHECGAHCIMN